MNTEMQPLALGGYDTILQVAALLMNVYMLGGMPWQQSSSPNSKTYLEGQGNLVILILYSNPSYPNCSILTKSP